jgi:glutamine---fructose-6-phosphate transaminase (isomerizing)
LNGDSNATFQEIMSQPEVWARALALASNAIPDLVHLWYRLHKRRLLFTGCGSSYYLGMTSAAVAIERGLSANALPASQIWLAPQRALHPIEDSLLIVISRSGETSEAVRAVERFRQLGGIGVVLLSCEPDSRLAQLADLTLAVPVAQEKSLTQTRSFSSLLLSSLAFVDAIVGDGGFVNRAQVLPALGKKLLETYGPIICELGGRLDLRRLFFLGNGPLFGLANEAMLKVKEMSLSDSEAYYTLEFRHGPMALVDSATLVIGLIADCSAEVEDAVLAELRQLGAHTLSLREQAGANGPDPLDMPVLLCSGLNSWDRLVLYLPILQLLGVYRARAKGLDADAPRNLNAFVRL